MISSFGSSVFCKNVWGKIKIWVGLEDWVLQSERLSYFSPHFFEMLKPISAPIAFLHLDAGKATAVSFIILYLHKSI